jgi:hypothetical protein
MRASDPAPLRMVDRRLTDFVEGLLLSGIGPASGLYCDGHQLEVSRTVLLGWWQIAPATDDGTNTLAAGIATFGGKACPLGRMRTSLRTQTRQRTIPSLRLGPR